MPNQSIYDRAISPEALRRALQIYNESGADNERAIMNMVGDPTIDQYPPSMYQGMLDQALAQNRLDGGKISQEAINAALSLRKQRMTPKPPENTLARSIAMNAADSPRRAFNEYQGIIDKVMARLKADPKFAQTNPEDLKNMLGDVLMDPKYDEWIRRTNERMFPEENVIISTPHVRGQQPVPDRMMNQAHYDYLKSREGVYGF